jgi:hypothetical protein
MYKPNIMKDLNPKVIEKTSLIDNKIDEIDEEILYREFFENSFEDGVYICSSCLMQVDVVNGDKGFCEHCESVVFIEKA